MKKIVFLALLAALVLPNAALALTALNVPAVDTNGNGVLTEIQANVVPGTGGVFVDIEPFISVDTQQSAKIAAQVAAKEAGVSLANYDVLFKIAAKTQVVDGPSGGGALALLAYSEFSKHKPRADLAVTGTIERDGSIGAVGGVWEKALSLRNSGVKLFLIPQGQTIYQGRNIAVEAQGFGVQVVEVRNLQGVVKYAFTPEGSAVQSQAFAGQPLVLQKIRPSSQLDPLKRIALDEISFLQQAASQLGSSNDSSALRQSILATINESRYMVDQGYYYSAANDVFIAEISLEAFKLQGTQQIDFMRMVQQLDNQAKKMAFAPETVENIEWVVGAKLRYYWALDKIHGIKESIGLVDQQQLYADYAAAKLWLAASQKLNQVAIQVGGSAKANELPVREYAARLINSLNQSQAFVLDSEVEQHYSGAVSAYANGDYSTAFFDGLFAKTFADAGDQIVSQTGGDYEKQLLGSGKLQDYGPSLWAQYYFIHSLYEVAEANATNQFVYTANALKLQEFSGVLKDQIPFLKSLLAQEGSGNPAGAVSFPSPAPAEDNGMQVQTTIIPQSSQSDVIVLVLLVVGGILILAVLLKVLSNAARQPEKPMGPVEKIEKIDEMLLQGKISEKNWETLHERYFKQIKQLKNGSGKKTGKTRKTR